MPSLVFRVATDLLQILWCPLVHEDEDDQYVANPSLHRRSTELTAAGAAAEEAAANEAGAVNIDNARLLCAMISRGDGYSPVLADLDASGATGAVRASFANTTR
ncbi:hypothetical protein ACFV9E_09710 [Streptomyces sp. NPDC059835]|uniref:hypothetical protein n=1 Tax=Streptomyces sp. NPDC059835 TaxID=3346967 RepID=UPI00366254FE